MKKFTLLCLSLCMSLSLIGCTNQKSVSNSSPYTFADTIAWDAEYDVIVAGFGAAGSVASKHAAESDASVLLVEKMEEGKEGGNSKVAGQLFAYGNQDEEATRAYYMDLAGDKPLDPEVLDVIVKGVAHMREHLNEVYKVPMEDFVDWSPIPVIGEMSPEYPWLEGADKIGLWTTHQGISDGYLYGILKNAALELSDKIDIWYESPAVELIQDPVSKTVIGMVVERDGKMLNVRALNGVVMATGGFECNKTMVEDYLGLGDYAVIGGQYNTGDGIRMVQKVGADLWHMETYEGGFFNAGLSLDVEDGVPQINLPIFGGGGAITVGQGGKRYIPEEIFAKHGHVPNNGVWANPRYPAQSFVVWDETYNTNVMNTQKLIPEEFKDDIFVANSLEELAKKAGINYEGLKVTINNYNQYAKDGFDPEFGRSAKTMMAFDNGPYYAIYVKPSILNTQGGPRKNSDAQVLDIDGNPIPHLYVAGEMGGITSNQYQGGTNLGECIIFGEIAGKNAAAKKDELPVYTPLEKVKSTPTKLGEVTDYTKFEIELKDNELLGKGKGIGGEVYVKVTMDGDKIIAIEVVKHSETPGRSDPAFESVPNQIIEKQSVEVDTVAGATITSKAIIEAVNDALNK